MALDIEQCMRRLHASKEVVVDVETSGLSWQKNHVVGWVLTFGERDEDSFYLPVRHAGGGNIPGCDVPTEATGWKGDVHPLEQEIVKGLDQQGKHLIFHNGHFDLRFMWRVGFTKFDATFEDTMLDAVLCDEWHPSVSLDALCKAYGVVQKKVDVYEHIASIIPEAKGDKTAMAHYWRLSGADPVGVDYARGDGTSTWQLRDRLRAEIELQNLALVHSVECRLIPVLSRMMTRGIRIDEDRLHFVKGEIERLREASLRSLPVDFNSRAPSQVRKLMEEHGHLDWPMTAPTKAFPKGQPSFNEQWLSSTPIGLQIIKVRKYSNLLASFIEPMLESHLHNGRVFPDYHQLRGDEFGTITGRLSSSNPNLQQVSKRNKELGALHRSIFVPDDGMLWGSADYSQMEPRLLAYYSRCVALIEGYKASPPIDAHQTAANLAGIDRETGKRVNQTLITGGGKGVLTSKYKIPVDKVDEVWDKYFEALPEIKTLQRTASARMRHRGYIISLLGRRSRLKYKNKDYVAVNRLLQCGNADCLKLKICEMDDYYRSEGSRVTILSNCHDAVETQFRPEDRKVYEQGLRIMTAFGKGDTINIDVPMVVDTKEGKNWAEATYG